jgi:cation transport ATPase
MKCFNHNAVDATATCQDCGKGLCVECSSRFDTIFCEPCLLKHNSLVSRQMYVGLVLTAAIFVGATYFFGSVAPGTVKAMGLGSAAIVGLLLAFTFWGWRFLSNYLPRLTRGNVFTWAMYLALKFVAAYFIGIVVGPYQIFKHFREIYRARNLKQQLVRSQA